MKRKTAITVALIIVLFFRVIPEQSLAETATGYSGIKIVTDGGVQTFYSSDGNNEIISIKLNDAEKCVFRGKHVNSTAGLDVGDTHIVYATEGFTFTREKPSVTGQIDGVKYVSLKEPEYSLSEKAEDDGYLYTTYTFSWTTLDRILTELGYSESELNSGKAVTVYLSNIFCTRTALKTKSGVEYSKRKGGLITLQEMLSAEKWANRTREILKYYYSIPVTVLRIPKEIKPDIPPERMNTDDVAMELSPNIITGRFFSEEYDVSTAIPSSERITGELFGKDMLFEVRTKRVTGTRNRTLHFRCPYVLRYRNREGAEETFEGIATRTEVITYEYAYTKLEGFTVYMPEYAEFYSSIFENGVRKSECKSETGDSLKMCRYKLLTDDEHLCTDENGVFENEYILPRKEYTFETREELEIPGIEDDDIYSYMDAKCNISVRNDSLVIDGICILDDSIYENNTPEGPEVKNLESNIQMKRFVIEEELRASVSNGPVESYGNILYRKVQSLNSLYPEDIRYAVELNKMIIHTPVICVGQIIQDNTKYVQEEEYHSGVPYLVMGSCKDAGEHMNDSCDFTVAVSSQGKHIDAKGYGDRDYSKYVLESEVRFPFDVYEDTGIRNNTTDDVRIAEGTWISLLQPVRLYIGLDIPEGAYTAEFRSRAVNYSDTNNKYGNEVNLLMEEYGAVSSVEIRVIGKLYGLSVVQITGDRDWEECTLKNGFPVVRTGKNNELGFAQKTDEILPLLNGSNSLYKNRGVLRPGTTIRFCVKTIGNKSEENAPAIRADLFCLSEQKKNTEQSVERKPVYVYRYEIGENGKKTLQSEKCVIKPIKKIKNKDGSISWYYEMTMPKNSFFSIEDYKQLKARLRQNGVTSKDAYRFSKGYIVVSLDISTYDGEKRYLSYLNSGNNNRYDCCNMWKTEGYLTKRKDVYGKSFEFKYGDAFVFDASTDVTDGYRTDRLY